MNFIHLVIKPYGSDPIVSDLIRGYLRVVHGMLSGRFFQIFNLDNLQLFSRDSNPQTLSPNIPMLTLRCLRQLFLRNVGYQVPYNNIGLKGLCLPLFLVARTLWKTSHYRHFHSFRNTLRTPIDWPKI